MIWAAQWLPETKNETIVYVPAVTLQNPLVLPHSLCRVTPTKMPKSISRMKYFDVFFIFPADFEVSHMFSQFFGIDSDTDPSHRYWLTTFATFPVPVAGGNGAIVGHHIWRKLCLGHLIGHQEGQLPFLEWRGQAARKPTVSVVSSDPVKTVFSERLVMMGCCRQIQ